MLKEAVRLLSDPRVGKGDAELVQRAGWRLLPFLVITAAQPDSAQLCLASCAAQSSVLTQHPLTLNWAQGNRSSCFLWLLHNKSHSLIFQLKILM